ncbi:MAG: hypothetical protein MI742_10840 [Desulfobacterales bacterium]|nr:hypothetical protein [Desulfobacterales bacterium]
MEQRYIIEQDIDAGSFTLKEMAETDVGKFSILHQESFELDRIKEAVEAGAEAVINVVRNHNFFPARFSAHLLADGIISLLADGKPSAKLNFCDNDALEGHEEEVVEEMVDSEKELVEIDQLLEEDDAPDAEIEP